MNQQNKRHLPSPLQDLLPAGLRPMCTRLRCAKGDLLFTQGRKPDRMFYVAGGEVILRRLGSRGENVVLQRARQGFVAEASLQSSRYHCDAVAMVSADLVSIPIEPIRQALLVDQAFAMRWIAMLNK